MARRPTDEDRRKQLPPDPAPSRPMMAELYAPAHAGSLPVPRIYDAQMNAYLHDLASQIAAHQAPPVDPKLAALKAILDQAHNPLVRVRLPGPR